MTFYGKIIKLTTTRNKRLIKTLIKRFFWVKITSVLSLYFATGYGYTKTVSKSILAVKKLINTFKTLNRTHF